MSDLEQLSVEQAVGAVRQVLARAVNSLPVYLFGDEHQNSLVRTMDEHDRESPIKPLPDRPHLRELTKLLETRDQLIVAKSRQMMVSWWAMACISHELLSPGRRWNVACRKFESADGLLDRCWGILERLPGAKLGNQRIELAFLDNLRLTRREGTITAHHGDKGYSQVIASSQDSDTTRSKTFSGILIDEADFTDNLDELWRACKPTAMAGGKVLMVSSPNGRGRFYQLLTDEERVKV